MRRAVLLLGSILWVSCGLETVPSLSAPDVSFSDQTLVTDQSLAFFHDGGRYDTSPFLGYAVYYKVYPVSATADFAQLLSDRSALSASPTVNQLANLGYQSLTFSRSSTATTSAEDVLIQVSADKTKVTLDFSGFLGQPTSETLQPLLLINDSPAPSPYLYRASSLVGTPNQTFAALRSATGRSSDMASWNSSELTKNQYEVNVFVVAYGLTPSLESVYSSPVPWGVIRTIGP